MVNMFHSFGSNLSGVELLWLAVINRFRKSEDVIPKKNAYVAIVST